MWRWDVFFMRHGLVIHNYPKQPSTNTRGVNICFVSCDDVVDVRAPYKQRSQLMYNESVVTRNNTYL